MSNYSIMSQEVNLSLNTTYANLPGLDASKVRLDNKLFVTLVLNDFSIKNYNVRLKLSIEGNGVFITSSDLYNYKSYVLIPGVPKVITSFDLADYFHPESLDFRGIDKNTFLENGILPEGTYKLCFVVVDGQSDGANRLSNTECDILTVSYQDPPVIKSDLNDVLDTRRVEWTHNSSFANQVNYTLEIYEFKGGKDFEIYTYQKPTKTIKAGSKLSSDISVELAALPKDKLYAIFVKAEGKQGSNYEFKNKGYSKSLYFEDIFRSSDCTGVVEFQEIPGPNGTALLYAFVDGCEPLFGAFQYGGFYSNTVPYVPGTGYTANIYCENPNGQICVYTGTYGNPSCILESSCVSANGCLGTLTYNCECVEECITVPIRESYNEDGQLVLTPMEEVPGVSSGLPSGCLGSQNFMWTSGESTASITPENPNATYGFTVVCADGCTYCGVYNKRSGCWPGRICYDGDPCTIDDKMDANCNCVGTHIAGCDPGDPSGDCAGFLSINVTIDPSGGSFLTADVSNIGDQCAGDQIQYVWNNDYENNLDYYYTSAGGIITLLILCESGCTFYAELDLNTCVPGSPCEDDGNPATIEYFDENCECVSFPCPDTDGDGLPDDCDEEQPCDGSISIVTDLPNQQLNVNIENVNCDGYISYLWSTGVTTASIPFLNEDATYGVTVTCSTGCQYTAISEGNEEDCMVGAECENDKSCNGLGTINENCECIPQVPAYNFDATIDFNINQVSLEVELIDGVCESPTYQWSTGATTASIILSSLNAVYSVTVSCENDCEFVAFYQYTEGDCVIGAPCTDGDPCTINDEFDNECNCVGTPIIDDCEVEDPCTNFIPCDDGDPCTYFDQVVCVEGDSAGGGDSEPPCAGIYLNDENENPVTDCGPDPCIVGYPCNDSDPCTINDAIAANCDCIGEQLFEVDGTTPQTDCDETNPCVESLTIDILPTNNYNEVLLSAVSTCANVDSYLWSNGSGASSIVVASQSGSYTVIVTCGACQYIATYDTDGCLVGLPCNDGLECTENDEVQENCECMGEPIEELEITFVQEDVFETTCDYSGCLPSFDVFSQFTITSIDVILPSGIPFQLNQGMNLQGFDFPYCYAPLSSNCPPLSAISVLASDIASWLGEQSIAYIQNNNAVYSSCTGIKVLKINNSKIEFTAINGYSDLGDQLTFGFDKIGCNEDTSPIGVNVTANIDCIEYDEQNNVIPNEYIWSDGTINPSAYIPLDENGDELYCLEVTITCANGCMYTETFGNNCEVLCSLGVYGSLCDDLNPCTINDSVNEECQCVGLPLADSDEDGICDEDDECPLGDDNIDLDDNGIPDACEEEFNCTTLLSAEIIVEIEEEQCVYCMMLDHPIFTDPQNDEDIYLHSISVINNGVPQLLSGNGNGFSFPYLVDKNSATYLPSSLTVDLYAYFGVNSEFTLTETPDPVCLKETDQYNGPSMLGLVNLPSMLEQMTFVWGGSNTFNLNFFQSPVEPCATLTPYTLIAELTTIEAENCGAEPTYLWSNGSTESSIEVVSMLPKYTVTITCGVCQAIGESEFDIGGGCEVEVLCEGFNECGDSYSGFYDEYCNCISENIPACDDDCDSEYEQIFNGATICCDQPPFLNYEEEPVAKNVYNSCFKFSDDDIIEGFDIKGIYMDAANDVDNYFDFPYCIENNCSYYGSNIDIPYNLKPYKDFAYDLQKWALSKEFEFTISTTNSIGLCNQCGTGENQIYINGSDTDEKIDIYLNSGAESMNTCDPTAEAGYNVVFSPYSGCSITKVTVKINNSLTFEVADVNGGIDLSGYKFGPVPHKGVGFRAMIECLGGCIYDIVTPDADCIVGDPCDSPDVCATETITTYNQTDCFCEVVETNDIDEDGVCDDEDICMPDLPYTGGYSVDYDDNIDNDNNGIPDGCQEGECGSEICTSIANLSAGNCVDADPCGILRNIIVELPDGTQLDLATLPYFSFEYRMNVLGGGSCADDEQLLETHIKDWLSTSGYIFKEVSVQNGQVKITDSNVKFINMLNICRDIFPFNTSCIPPLCGYSVYHREDIIVGDECIYLDDIIVEIDGSEKSLKEFPEFSFPYCSDFQDKVCNLNCQHFDKLILDIEEAFGITISIEKEGTPTWFLRGIIVPPTDIVFKVAFFNGKDIPFDQNNCTYGCDDGWICTVNDYYDENCNCVGTYLDSDNDMVCDAEDLCPDYPDHFDADGNGIPDGCEEDIYIPCAGSENGKPYCDFIQGFLSCATGKVKFNNLIVMNGRLSGLFSGDPNMIDYLPFPSLRDELSAAEDFDQDGIVDILDPCPCIGANADGTHPVSCMMNMCEVPCNELNDKFVDKDYMKERHTIMNMLLYTVNPGVLVGSNADDSNNPIYSQCFEDLKGDYGLNYGDYNESGYVFSQTTGCYIYFELDCDCNCLVVESEAFNYAEDCQDPLVIGDECTQDASLAGTEGYHYVECPPAGADACMIYGVVSNQDYDPYDSGGEVPCNCEQQMDSSGDPSETIDSDGDGICDILDECAPAVDADGNSITDATDPDFVEFDDNLDTDGDGLPDCRDKCPDDIIDPIFTKEGYSEPSGPGDVCDDGNPCTYDDVITADCKCQGVYIDLDDDGVYDCEGCEYVENPIGSGIYTPCEDCGGTVQVDAIGNVVDPNSENPNPIAHTWIGCDVCPGIPDGDPEDQDDYPMDYNNNGLPDCIDPPFKPICPDEFEIADGVGLVLFFNTDDLDEGDYPEPISFQGISTSNGELVYYDYLTVDYTREVVVEVEDETSGELIEKTITEVYYTIPYTSFDSGEFEQAIITYSDHQSCVLTNNDIVPLPCPYSISIQYGKISFNQSDLGEIDLSELIGEYVIQSGDEIVKINPSVDDIEFTNSLVKVDIEAELLDVFSENFSGTVTLPSGLVCEFNNNAPEECQDGILPGTPCNDDDECTHHDKYLDTGSGTCECIGEPKPDSDNDGFCDAIDPCPEDWNAMPPSGLVEDIDDCPCPMLELSAIEDELPGLQNGNDFYVYFTSDLSGYSDITIEVDNGQDDPFDPTGGAGVEAVSPMVIGNLVGGYTYTITITAFCDNGEPQTVTLEIDVPFGDSPIICGVEMDPFDITSLTMLPSLSSGEEFVASDFIVTTKQVSGSYGNFSGKGYISIPFFNEARLNVSFENITISIDRQMVDGYISIDGFGLAILGDDISDAINGALDGIISVLEDINEVLEELIPLLESIEKFVEETGHLVDEELVECLLGKKEELENLKTASEATPKPSDDEMAQIKLDIERVAAELQVCKDEYDAQLEVIMSRLIEFTNYSVNELGKCNLDDLSEAYDLANDSKMSDFIAEKNEIISGLPLDESNEFDVIESEISQSISTELVISDEEKANLLNFYSAILEYDFCLAMKKLKLTTNGSGLTLEELKEFMNLLTTVGIDLTDIISTDLKDSNIPIETIFDKYEYDTTNPNLISNSFKKIIINKSYKKN